MPELSHYQRVARGAVRRATRRTAIATLLLVPTSVRAQQGTPTAPSLRAPSPITWHDARVLGAFTLSSAALMASDRDVQRMMQRPWVQSSALLKNTADAFNAYGSPGVFVGSLGLYAVGWAGNRPDVARLGLRAWESIALSGVVTGGIKGVAGRARPYASPGRPGDWRILSGTHDAARQSFPSGHSTAVFAFASALDHELRVSHPAARRWAVPLLYGAAVLTDVARTHANKHWASDVVLGSGIGYVSGVIVARFHTDRPQHWIDRHLLPRGRP